MVLPDAIASYPLYRLIADVAHKLGDSFEFEATGGTSTTLVDTLNIPQGSHSFTRRQLLFISGTYAGEARVITATTPGSFTVTFSPALGGAVSAGDMAVCINAHGGGPSILEIKRQINAAIANSYPLARTPLVSSNLTVDMDVPTLTVPDSMDEVYAVEWLDDDGIVWSDIPSNGMRGGSGWWFNQPEGVITLFEQTASMFDGYTVRLRGEGRHPELANMDDETTLDHGWLVAEAAYQLSMSLLDRDMTGNMKLKAAQFEREARMMLPRIRTRYKPTSYSVRRG